MMEEELDLLDLFFAFWKKRMWLMIAIIVGAVSGFLYTEFMVVPKYTSSVTLILAKASTESTTGLATDATGAITQSDITLNQKLISTYGEILKSRRIAYTVIDSLELNMTYQQLINCVAVSFVKDSDVIKLSITTTDPELSAKIANEMTGAFTDEVARIYNIQNVAIIDSAEVNTNPVNVSFGKNVIIFALIAFVIVAVVIFLIYYFDNTVKTEENVKKITGLPVLCSIPVMDVKKGGN